jgi:predicted nucleic acid-binding protein
MIVVVDSNIFIAFALSDEPLHSHASDILRVWHKREIDLAAPALFRSEITAVIRKIVYQERITHEEGHKILKQLLLYPVRFYDDNALLLAAYEIAHRFNRPRAYDAQYLALAEKLDCEFWTADERMFNAVRDRFDNIRWLGEGAE